MIAGIVPSFNGALAIIAPDGRLHAAIDMPTEPSPGTVPPRDRTSVKEMGIILRRYGVTQACVAKLSPSPSKSVIQTFNYGMVAGLVQGALAVLGVPVTIATLSAMTAFHALPEDRGDARMIAARLWPDATMIQRNAHAEAALLALYGAGLRAPAQSNVSAFRKAV